MSCANIAQNRKICNVPGKYFVSFFSLHVVQSVRYLASVIIGSTLKKPLRHQLASLLGDRQIRLLFIQVFKYFFTFQTFADCSPRAEFISLPYFQYVLCQRFLMLITRRYFKKRSYPQTLAQGSRVKGLNMTSGIFLVCYCKERNCIFLVWKFFFCGCWQQPNTRRRKTKSNQRPQWYGYSYMSQYA